MIQNDIALEFNSSTNKKDQVLYCGLKVTQHYDVTEKKVYNHAR